MEDERARPGDEGVKGELNQDRFLGGRDLTRWHNRVGRSVVAAVRWISGRLGPHGALILTLSAGVLMSAGLSAVFAQVYEAVTDADGVAGLDRPVLEAGQSIRSPVMDVVVTAYTDVGGGIGLSIIALIGMAVLGLRRRSWTPVILIVTGGAGALLMVIAGKQLIGRSRPPLSDAVPPFEYSAAFPSGHALGSVVIAGIVAYLVVFRQKSSRARLGTILVATFFTVTIGLSRVYLGHHWLTDVLAAWTLGAAWLALVITAHRLYLTVRQRSR